MGGCVTYSRETKPTGLWSGGELSYSMDLTKVRTVPGRSRKGSELWFINKANLHKHITHPEWGLWKGYNLSKKPQTLLGAPKGVQELSHTKIIQTGILQVCVAHLWV